MLAKEELKAAHNNIMTVVVKKLCFLWISERRK